jgi:hypothetical protein
MNKENFMVVINSDFESQARQMRDQLVAVATEEADRWLAGTLAMLRRLPCSGAERGQSASDSGSPAPIEKQGRNGTTLAAATRKAIDLITTDKFNSVQLRHLIEPYYPIDGTTQRANLSNLLRRMVAKGEIDLIRKGAGSRPSVYRKKAVEPMKTEGQG